MLKRILLFIGGILPFSLIVNTVNAGNDQSMESLMSLDLVTLLTIEIDPSADASAKGLSKPLPGGQLAQGARFGFLGNEAIREFPYSVTSYTQSYIQNQQAQSVGHVLQYDPTVRVALGFGNFLQLYRIRGFHVFSDDMMYNGLYGILPRQYVTSELIERVEIIRGTTSFLNGASPSNSSLGGAINVMPKRATLQPITQLTFGISSEQQDYLAMDFGRRFSNDQWGIRINIVEQQGESPVEPEQRELGMATLGVDYTSGRVRFSGDLGYQDHSLQQSQPSVTFSKDLPIGSPPPADRSIAQPWTYANERDWFGSIRAELDATDQLTLWMAAGAREGYEDSVFESSVLVINEGGDITANRFDVVHEDSVLTLKLGAHYHWQINGIPQSTSVEINGYENESRNAFIQRSPVNDNLYSPAPSPPPTTVTSSGGDLNNPNITQTTRRTSYAIANTTYWQDELKLTVGARLQHLHDLFLNYDTGDKIDRYEDHIITPLVAAVRYWNPNWSSFANYSEGLQRGTDDPLRATQVEVGTRWQYQGISHTWSLYHIRKERLGLNDNSELIELNKDAVHRGVEWLIYGEISQRVRTFGGISLINTKVEGSDAIGTPREQINFNLEWDSAASLTLSTHLMYTGDQYADTANQQTVPSWWRLDLGVRYQRQISESSSTTIRLKFENVTDRNYWASAGGFPGFGYLTQGKPRTLITSMSIDF